MVRRNDIPKEDLDLINKSFESEKSDVIDVNVHGRIVKAEKKVVNETKIRLENYSGRILRHQKAICINGRGTIVIGVKGDEYDKISDENKKLVKWFESDFEPIT